jgi:predicted alpha/beta hydrolase
MTEAAINESRVRFEALDGYDLGGTLYSSRDSGPPPTVLLLCCGGGIPASRYARLARFLAAKGFPVLAFDYRGIGDSRPAHLRALRAGNEDWSEHDCGGAIAEIRRRFPAAELVAIAHSIGPLLVGGAPNVAEVSRFVFIGAHTGYFGDYLGRYRLPMAVMWHGVMPVLVRLVGYFPGRALRLGEDIPRQVAWQWATRRTPDFHPKHAGDVARGRAWLERHYTVQGRALVIAIVDDAFATESGTRRLLGMYPRLQVEHERIRPADVGLKRIGHFGYFRRLAEANLWPRIVAFLRDDPQWSPQPEEVRERDETPRRQHH